MLPLLLAILAGSNSNPLKMERGIDGQENTDIGCRKHSCLNHDY